MAKSKRPRKHYRPHKPCPLPFRPQPAPNPEPSILPLLS